MAEVSASSLDSQFQALEDTSGDLEVEARLAALKGGGTPAPAAAPAPAAPPVDPTSSQG